MSCVKLLLPLRGNLDNKWFDLLALGHRGLFSVFSWMVVSRNMSWQSIGSILVGEEPFFDVVRSFVVFVMLETTNEGVSARGM